MVPDGILLVALDDNVTVEQALELDDAVDKPQHFKVPSAAPAPVLIEGVPFAVWPPQARPIVVAEGDPDEAGPLLPDFLKDALLHLGASKVVAKNLATRSHGAGPLLGEGFRNPPLTGKKLQHICPVLVGVVVPGLS